MVPAARKLALLQLLGGPAVLASYVWCIAVWPEASSQMWGGVPEAIQPLYTAWMFVAAAGYFAYSYVFILRTDLDAFAVPLLGRERGVGLLGLSYALVLGPSALWMPMTKWMLDDPSALRFWLVRLDLFAVALGSIGLILAAASVRPRPPGRLRALALIGTLAFAVQTVVLDALIWPALWR